MATWDEIQRETVVETDWFTVYRSDFELPDGSVGRSWNWTAFPAPAVGVVAVREDGAILLVNQFRFTTRTRDWEIPAGRVDPGETTVQAAARELREETGHSAAQLELLGRFFPTNGSSNQEFVLYVARHVVRAGPIEDTNEVDDARWFPEAMVRAMLARNEILDGMSVSGLLWYLFKYG